MGQLSIKNQMKRLKSFFSLTRTTFVGMANFLVESKALSLSGHYNASFETIPTLADMQAKAFIRDGSFDQSYTYHDAYLQEDVVKKPLRVMMIGLRGFPNVQGGVEKHAEHLAPLLVKQGCELEVIVRSPYQSLTAGDNWQGVRFTRIWAPKSKGLEAVVHTFLGVLYAGVVRPDILHIHAIGPALMTPLARLLGLKVVVTHHGPDYNRQKWGGFARNILLLGEWFGMRFSNSRIVISNAIRELVVRKHTVHSELIFNGVVIPDLEVSDVYLNQFGLQQNKYILLVSRLVPEKRHLDLIAAFVKANVAGYKLVFVGSSDHPDAYVQAVIDAAKQNENIVLTGFQTGEALRCLYAHAALFVLPSSHEGLSISLLEALSYGLPVLASDIPANLELGLNPATYFELGNIDELAQLLQKNLVHPASHELRTYLRNWVATQYNWLRIAERTYKEYQSVL